MNGPRARETVQKLWNASKSLQGGGVSYYEYVTELTYLLLLKMLSEVKRSFAKGEEAVTLETFIPADCRWDYLRRLPGQRKLDHYNQILLTLGTSPEVNGTAKSIDPSGLAVVAGELHAVAGAQLHRLRLEHLGFASAPLSGMPVKRPATAAFQNNAPAFGIDCGNRKAFAPAHAFGGIVAAEPDDIADGIACWLSGFGTSQAFRFKSVESDRIRRQLAALG